MAVITISRQSGSEGNEITRILCERLGYGFFDKKMLAALAKEVGWDPQQVEDLSADLHHVKTLRERIASVIQAPEGPAAGGLLTYDEALTLAQVQHLILEAYNLGNVVIVGRGSQVVLADKADVLHVRVVAPLETRIQKWQTRLALEREDALRVIEEHDKAHVDFVATYFEKDLHDPLLYDLVINTGKLSASDAADVIIEALKKL